MSQGPISDADRAAVAERILPFVTRARNFSGWDTQYYSPRMLEAGPPWDYEGRARELLAGATSVLDIGTGGAEFFSRLVTGFKGRVTATEPWDVNYDIASKRLRPLGARVVYCSSLELPFEDGEFDLVLDRHEELEPAEAARVLAPGGHLMTQQVGNKSWPELRHYFPRRTDFGDLFGRYLSGFEAAGLECQAQEHSYRVAFRNLGQLVGMLLIAPWDIPDFDPLGSDLDALILLERELTTANGIEMTEARFLIEGVKPA